MRRTRSGRARTEGLTAGSPPEENATADADRYREARGAPEPGSGAWHAVTCILCPRMTRMQHGTCRCGCQTSCDGNRSLSRPAAVPSWPRLLEACAAEDSLGAEIHQSPSWRPVRVQQRDKAARFQHSGRKSGHALPPAIYRSVLRRRPLEAETGTATTQSAPEQTAAGPQNLPASPSAGHRPTGNGGMKDQCFAPAAS